MTVAKQLKARIRERMARTGERYAVARAHVVGAADRGPEVDAGWTLRGGTDPDAAALANVLAHQGVTGPDGPLSEALLLVVGGLGAGYILWEFERDDSRIVVLGFTHSWQYYDRRLRATAERLGLGVAWSRTGGTARAAGALAATLAAGTPAIVWPDRYHLGYWKLPAFLDGHGGHPVVAYALTDGRVHVDDRTLAPLTVPEADFDRARARVGSYQNTMMVVRTRTPPSRPTGCATRCAPGSRPPSSSSAARRPRSRCRPGANGRSCSSTRALPRAGRRCSPTGAACCGPWPACGRGSSRPG